MMVLLFKYSTDSRPISYRDFINQTQTYYTNLAIACSKLWTASQIHGVEEREIPSNSPELPKILQELHASKVVVYSNIKIQTNTINHVSLMIGKSRGGYGISWQQVGFVNGEEVWELSVGNEGAGEKLLSIRDSELKVLAKVRE